MKALRALNRVLAGLTWVLTAISAAAFFIVVVVAIIGREAAWPLAASEELASLLFLWSCFGGAALAYRRHEHIQLTFLTGRLPASGRKQAARMVHGLVLVFLVVVDETPELRVALRYACRRAKRTGGRIAMLYVMEPPEPQQWSGISDLMREEARQQAEATMTIWADQVLALTGQRPILQFIR